MSTTIKRNYRRALLLALAPVALAIAVFTALDVSPAQGAEGNDARAALRSLSEAFIEVSEAASPAVVYISVEKEMTMPHRRSPGSPQDLLDQWFFGPGRPDPRRRNQTPRGGQEPKSRIMPYGQGTGFIISKDGYIVTNHHVVGDADRIKVRLADGREFDAEITGSDPQTEIALIKVEAEDLPTLSLGDSDKLRVGEWVLAIGNPFGLSHSVTTGIVSARGRGNVAVPTRGEFYADFIQTDAAINPGNSGGPLLNLDGKVVGMNTLIFSRSGGYMGIGFAIPVNMIKPITDQLIDHGSVRRGLLGVIIQNLTPDLADHLGVDRSSGVLVADVQEDGPADKAGLKAEDVILELDGKAADDVGTFRSRVASTMPGTRVKLVLLRNGKKITKKVRLGEIEEDGVQMSATRDGAKAKIGLTVQDLTDEIAEKLGYEGEEGVVVTRVEPGSPAARAGLKPGNLIKELNREPVRNVGEFSEAMKGAQDGKSIMFLVLDEDYSHFTIVKLDD